MIPSEVITLTDAARKYMKQPWSHLYDKSRWKHPVTGLKAATLRRDIICVVCNRAPSTVGDHIVDHRGSEPLFWDPKNVRGVCKPCHDNKTGTQHGANHGTTPQKPHVINGIIQSN